MVNGLRVGLTREREGRIILMKMIFIINNEVN